MLHGRRKTGPRGQQLFHHQRWKSLDWSFSYTDQELWKQQHGFYETQDKLQRWKEEMWLDTNYEDILPLDLSEKMEVESDDSGSARERKNSSDSLTLAHPTAHGCLNKKLNHTLRELMEVKRELSESLQREEQLKKELELKEESITELNKRYALLNEEATKARDHAKRLEKEITFVCSYQSVFVKDKKAASRKFLEKERQYFFLKTRYRDLLTIVSQKVKIFNSVIQENEEKCKQLESTQKQLREANKLIKALSKELEDSKFVSNSTADTI